MSSKMSIVLFVFSLILSLVGLFLIHRNFKLISNFIKNRFLFKYSATPQQDKEDWTWEAKDSDWVEMNETEFTLELESIGKHRPIL